MKFQSQNLLLPKLVWLFLATTALVGCSSSDDDANTQANEMPSVRGLSFTAEALLEYQYRSGQEQGSFRNLTLEENYPVQYEFIHRQRGVFGLYRIQNVWMRDVVNSATEQFLDYTTPGESERREAVVNDELHIALLYRKLDALDQLQLRIINAQNNVQSNINFGTFEGVSQIYLYENSIIVTLKNLSTNTTQLYVINVDQGQINTENTFLDTGITAVIFGDNDDYYFFAGDQTYKRFSLSTSVLLEEQTTAFTPESGRVYEIENRLLVGNYFYLQPSFFNEGPLLYDLNTNTITTVDLGAALTAYMEEQTNGSRIENTDFVFDRDSGSWIANYLLSFSDDRPDEFGLVQIDREGVLQNVLQTEFPITRVVLY